MHYALCATHESSRCWLDYTLQTELRHGDADACQARIFGKPFGRSMAAPPRDPNGSRTWCWPVSKQPTTPGTSSIGLLLWWCWRGGSNPHALLERQILSLVRLPIPPLQQKDKLLLYNRLLFIHHRVHKLRSAQFQLQAVDSTPAQLKGGICGLPDPLRSHLNLLSIKLC